VAIPVNIASESALSLSGATSAVLLADVGSVLPLRVASPGEAAVGGPYAVVVLDVSYQRVL
jgi:hypothetical protein